MNLQKEADEIAAFVSGGIHYEAEMSRLDTDKLFAQLRVYLNRAFAQTERRAKERIRRHLPVKRVVVRDEDYPGG